jgi:hypothetical protein
MSLNYPKPGLGHVAEFQRACTPYVDSCSNNTKTITLNYVTSEVIVVATAACTVHFGDVDSKTVSIPAATTVTFKVRTKKIVLASGGVASVCALLTGISSNELPQHDQDDWGSTA